jgi:hypothetical protein
MLENIIADRREFYNDSVNLYNISIEQIPAVWVAQQVGYSARPLLVGCSLGSTRRRSGLCEPRGVRCPVSSDRILPASFVFVFIHRYSTSTPLSASHLHNIITL